MQAADDQKARAIAEEIERENPGWIVIFGLYSGQFVCFPLFPVPPGTMVVARYPHALAGRMREVEASWRPVADSRKDMLWLPQCRPVLTAGRETWKPRN